MSPTIRTVMFLTAPVVFLFILPFPHTIALRLFTLLLTVIGAIWVFRHSVVPSFPLWKPVVAWVLAVFLSLYWAVDPGYSLQEIKNEIGYSALAFAAFYILTDGDKRLKNWSDVLLVGVIALLVFELTLWWPSSRTTWMSHRYLPGVGSTSTYLLTVVPLVYVVATLRARGLGADQQAPPREARLPVRGVLLLGIPVLFVFTGFMTHNLMFWPVLFVLVSIVLVMMRGYPVWRLLFLVLLLVAVLFAYGTVANEKGRRVSLSGESISAHLAKDPRVGHWKNVGGVIKDSPWVGGGFGIRTLSNSQPEKMTKGMLWHAHNLFLDYAVQLGIPGLLVFLVLIAGLLQRFLLYARQDGALRIVGIGGAVLVAAVISKNMTDNFFYRDLSLLFWAEIGMFLGYGERLLKSRA